MHNLYLTWVSSYELKDVTFIFRHILEVHKKEKRHICQFCEKTFFKLSSKKRHELTHVTHDTWKCSRCMKIFKDESSLKYHVKKNVCLTKKSKMAKKLQNV